MPVTGLKVVIHHMPATPPSLPWHGTGDVAAGAVSRQREQQVTVALVTTGGCIVSPEKLGRSQEVFLGSF